MDSKQSKKQSTFRIDLTDEQRRKVLQATGKKAEAIELSTEEVEERIVPAMRWR